MAQQQISPGTINAAIAALRFFFTVTLERPDLVRPPTTVNKPCKAPVVLSEEEVARLLEAARPQVQGVPIARIFGLPFQRRGPRSVHDLQIPIGRA